MKILDLFGGAQGSGVGYARAGFEVYSLDIEPHKRHLEIAGVIVMDAMAVLRGDMNDSDGRLLDQFDAVHAGPPCQGYSTMNRWRGKTPTADLTPRLIGEVRAALQRWGRPYVIENVVGARPHMIDPVLLRGGMFGLGVDRPRLFESNVPLTAPPLARKRAEYGVYGPLDGRLLYRRADGSEYRAPRTLTEGQAAMGIDWMAWRDLTEAIPPAYTQHVGTQLMAHLRTTAAMAEVCSQPTQTGTTS